MADGFDDDYVGYGTPAARARSAMRAFREGSETRLPTGKELVPENFAPMPFVSRRGDRRGDAREGDVMAQAEALMDEDEAAAHRARRIAAKEADKPEEDEARGAFFEANAAAAKGMELLQKLGWRRFDAPTGRTFGRPRDAQANRARYGVGFDPYASRDERALFQRHTTETQRQSTRAFIQNAKPWEKGKQQRRSDSARALPRGSAFGGGLDDGDFDDVDPYADDVAPLFATGGRRDRSDVLRLRSSTHVVELDDDDDDGSGGSGHLHHRNAPQPARLALPGTAGVLEGTFLSADEAAALLANDHTIDNLARDAHALAASLADEMRALMRDPLVMDAETAARLPPPPRWDADDDKGVGNTDADAAHPSVQEEVAPPPRAPVGVRPPPGAPPPRAPVGVREPPFLPPELRAALAARQFVSAAQDAGEKVPPSALSSPTEKVPMAALSPGGIVRTTEAWMPALLLSKRFDLPPLAPPPEPLQPSGPFPPPPSLDDPAVAAAAFLANWDWNAPGEL